RVRLTDGFARLQNALDGLPWREGATRFRQIAQIDPLQILHHHVRHARVESAYVEDTCDVFASKLTCSPCLTHEPCGGVCFTEHRRVDQLDRELLPELDVSDEEDNPHASAGKLAFDLVLAEERSAHCGRMALERT